MYLALKPHPDTPCEPVRELRAEVMRVDRKIVTVLFEVIGDLEHVRFPPGASPGRADDLWKQTCFEAFIGAAETDAYYEFNFSPSLQWAAYRFDGYRAGMASVGGDLSEHPPVFEAGYWQAEFSAILGPSILNQLSDLPDDLPWRLGVSAVIELRDGSKSYWALAHPPGQPDFHHRDAFAASLPPRNQ